MSVSGDYVTLHPGGNAVLCLHVFQVFSKSLIQTVNLIWQFNKRIDGRGLSELYSENMNLISAEI